MYICYVDEAGCTGVLPASSSAIQPVFTIAGIIFHQSNVGDITRRLINLKQKFFPNRLPRGSRYHDWMGLEIKGSDIRRMARSAARNERRFAYSVIQESLAILESHDAKILGRVFVKPIGGAFDGVPIYSSSVQRICTDFQHFLGTKNAWGIVIADSRNKSKNANISHSIFTQSYSATGNPYPNLIEVPTFGHSDNHAGLQLSDILCSAFFSLSPHSSAVFHTCRILRIAMLSMKLYAFVTELQLRLSNTATALFQACREFRLNGSVDSAFLIRLTISNLLPSFLNGTAGSGPAK